MRQVLVIAGDRDPPAGPFRSALEVIDSGLLAAPRHPRGRHRRLSRRPSAHPEHELDRALADKIAAAEATGFASTSSRSSASTPPRSSAGSAGCAISASNPVRIGLAGPTSLPTLLRYASRCGVSASVQGLARQAGLMRHLFAMSAPDAMVRALAASATLAGRQRARRRAAAFLLVRRAGAHRALGGGGRTRPIALEAGQGFQGRTGRLNKLVWCVAPREDAAMLFVIHAIDKKGDMPTRAKHYRDHRIISTRPKTTMSTS